MAGRKGLDATDISEFSYVWTTGRDDYVLVEGEYGYAIVDRRERAVLHIEDEEVDAAVVARMLEEGCAVYGGILEAYSDARG